MHFIAVYLYVGVYMRKRRTFWRRIRNARTVYIPVIYTSFETMEPKHSPILNKTLYLQVA